MKQKIAMFLILCMVLAMAGCSQTGTPQPAGDASPLPVSEPTETDAADETPSLTQMDWYDELPYESWAQFRQIESPVEFFDVYEMPGNVYAIVSNGHWELDICYLILGKDRAMLVDTGLGLADIQTVVNSLTELPVTVLLTHSHWDHVGGAYAFDDVWCFESEKCVDTVENGTEHDVFSYELEDGLVARPISEDIDLSTYSIRPAQVTGTVADGDVIDLGGRKLKVIYTPVHTADSICLVDEENGLLFTGDTYYPSSLYAWCDDSDVVTYSNSIRKIVDSIENIDIQWMYTGHNEVVEGSTRLKEVAYDLDSIVNGEADNYTIGEEGYRYYSFPNGIVIITLDEDAAA